MRGLWLVKRTLRENKLHARDLSTDQSILRFDVILQDDLPVEKCLLHIRVFFGGFDLFVHWLIKQITNTCRVIPQPLSKVIRKSLWNEFKNSTVFRCYCCYWSTRFASYTTQVKALGSVEVLYFPSFILFNRGSPPPSQFYRKRSNCPKAERRFYYWSINVLGAKIWLATSLTRNRSIFSHCSHGTLSGLETSKFSYG